MSYGAQWFLIIAIAVIFVWMAVVAAARRIAAMHYRRTVQVAALVVAVLGIVASWPMPEMPAWEQPAAEQERNAYDFAHSITLPDSIPKPVPFNFALARLRALIPGRPEVSEQ